MMLMKSEFPGRGGRRRRTRAAVVTIRVYDHHLWRNPCIGGLGGRPIAWEQRPTALIADALRAGLLGIAQGDACLTPPSPTCG